MFTTLTWRQVQRELEKFVDILQLSQELCASYDGVQLVN
jgi:hypothetical protein